MTTILEDWRTGGEEDKRTEQYDRRTGREWQRSRQKHWPSCGPGNQYDEYGRFHGRNTNLSKLWNPEKFKKFREAKLLCFSYSEAVNIHLWWKPSAPSESWDRCQDLGVLRLSKSSIFHPKQGLSKANTRYTLGPTTVSPPLGRWHCIRWRGEGEG